MKPRRWLPILFFATAVTAHAHETEAVAPGAWWTAWTWEPAVVTGLFATAALYASGLRSLRLATHARAKLRTAARCFFGGWLVLALALVSPVHALGGELFSVHMLQHELLMVLAAPLLVLGRPRLVWLWALPRREARWLSGALRRLGHTRATAWLGHDFTAWLAHAAALWIWHVPIFFTATLTNDAIHALQHTTFLGAAIWFWHAVFFGRWRRKSHGVGVLYLFTTALHSSALGALITFARHPWYAPYAVTAPRWGLTALEDQQLGGLIMWVPAGLAYVTAALVLFGSWLHAGHRDRSAAAMSNAWKIAAP